MYNKNDKLSSANQFNKEEIVSQWPVTYTLLKIGGWWKQLILNQLLTRTKRYGEIKKGNPCHY